MVWKSFRREFLAQFGLIGRALNARLDRGDADDEADHEPPSYSSFADATDEVLYQVLSPAGTIWQTQYVGSARDDASGMVVATNLQGLQRQFPDQQLRAVTRDGRLIDIRT
jgi:hypothetical protein